MSYMDTIRLIRSTPRETESPERIVEQRQVSLFLMNRPPAAKRAQFFWFGN